MSARPLRIPGPDHPITIERADGRIVVTVAAQVIADTHDALILREESYPGVLYLPRKDVKTPLLQRTDHQTSCPYKGDCSYYSIPIGGGSSVNAIWSYEAPYDAVAHTEESRGGKGCGSTCRFGW